MANGISFSGLASGLDTGAIIDALMQAARQPIDRLQAKKKTFNTQLGHVGTLDTKLRALRDAVQKIDTQADFRAYKVTSNDETKVKAESTGAATPGTYSFRVTQLAEAERTYSNTFGAKDQSNLLTAGTLGITVGTDTQVNITVEASDTLETLASKINNSTARVSAGVMSTGSAYRLVVIGEDSGAANGITFSDAGLNLNLSAAGNEMQAAQDAVVRIEERDINNYIDVSSASNTITNAVPGLSLNLLEATGTDKVTVQVAADPDAVQKKVEAFVTAYNDVIGFINGQFTYKGEARSDTLMGNAAVRNIKGNLQGLVGSEVDDIDETLNALSRVGIKTGSNGTLSIDSEDFKENLLKHFSTVADLFTAQGGDGKDGIATKMVDSLEDMLRANDGLMASSKKSLNDRMRDIDGRIASMERNLDTYEAGLRKQFLALEEMMSSLSSQGNYLSQQLR